MNSNAYEYIRRNNHGVDTLIGDATNENRFEFNSTEIMTYTFHETLRNYDQIVVNLPAVLPATDEYISPFASAASCDLLYVVCKLGSVTQREIREFKTRLDLVNLGITGVIINEAEQ